MTFQRAILVFALNSALLYSCLLPLWEGWDEPFHYAYIESLSVDHVLPIQKQTTISSEIRESLTLTPVSRILHRSLPRSISFEDWFTLTPRERQDKKTTLAQLPRASKNSPSDLLNYEAQQSPLAYLLLAPIDIAASRLTLSHRILLLRLIVSTVSAFLLFLAANALFDALQLNTPFRLAALLCIFESQMLWASVAHVGNDWLAIPLAAAFLAALARKHVLAVAALLAAGLLTKAYFLAFVPIFAALLIRRPWRTVTPALAIVAIAAPWYLRNLVLYGSISGTQETVGGVGLRQAASAFFQIDWLRNTIPILRWALWTGNWTFASFSRITLDLELLLIGIALILFARRLTRAEWWVISACGLFVLGFIYQICVTWVSTRGLQYAEPWYLQCILPSIWALAFLGCERSGLPGRVLAVLLVLTSAWIAIGTYVAKLFPMYGGFFGRSTVAAVWNWWRTNPANALSTVSLGPVPLVFFLLFTFLALLITLTVMVCKKI
jgi:hypothetical protein